MRAIVPGAIEPVGLAAGSGVFWDVASVDAVVAAR